MRREFVACSIALFGAVGIPVAQAEESRNEAELAVQRGAELYNKGDCTAAAHQFSRAYRLAPRAKTLLALGMSYSSCGNPVDGAATLEMYLEKYGAIVDRESRLRVQETLTELQWMLGLLLVRVSPAQAQVTVDGRTQAPQSPIAPLTVRAGEHVITARLEGYQAETVVANVTARRQEFVELVLLPKPIVAAMGQVAINCPAPGFEVRLGEQLLGTTPLLAPLLVPVGAHTLRLKRPGYRTQGIKTRVQAGGLVQVACDLKIETPLESSGQLFVDVGLSDVEVLIDGQSARPRTEQPSGLHLVEVRRHGFEPWKRQAYVSADLENRIPVQLEPLPAYLQEREEQVAHRRAQSYVLGGTGIVALGTAAVLGIWNHGRYSEWKEDRDSLGADYAEAAQSPADSSELDRRSVRAANLLESINSVDLWTAALGVAGGVMLGTSLYLYWDEGSTSETIAESSVQIGIAPSAFGITPAW